MRPEALCGQLQSRTRSFLPLRLGRPQIPMRNRIWILWRGTKSRYRASAGAVLAHGSHEQSEHLAFPLVMKGLERDDVAAGVVQDAVDPDRQAPIVDHDGGAVTHVGVPESAGSLGLPAEPDFAASLVADGDAVEALLLIEAAHAARRDGIRFEAPLRHEGAQDDGHRRGGVLLANVEQELPLLAP